MLFESLQAGVDLSSMLLFLLSFVLVALMGMSTFYMWDNKTSVFSSSRGIAVRFV